MIRVPPTGQVIHGFDISHYQPDFDAAMKKVQEPKFCFLKAVEGASGIDRSFEGHWTKAAATGLLRGAYAFYHPSQNPLAQAKHFCAVVGKLNANDLPMVMDWEVTDGAPAPKDVIGGLEFLNAVEALSGKTPIIYGSPYFLQALAMNEHFVKYPLWVASYNHQAPLVPAPWKSWEFWQTSGTDVDMNLFNGSLADLEAFATKV